MQLLAAQTPAQQLFNLRDEISPYIVARRRFMKKEEWDKTVQDLSTSATLYVGNLSFFTTEEQIYELFQRAGDVKRVIMGLNRQTKTPCGFCFVE